MIRKFLTTVFIVCCAYVSLNAQAYKLVWSDEFDGTQLNTANWTRETGGSGWGNNEWEYYTDREVNASVANGLLTITALKEEYNGMHYTSARLKTQNKQFFKYGKIEARMKLPYGQGIWPAFWTLGQSISSVNWPKCGEIDIMELVGGPGQDKTVYGTAHWDSGGHQYYGGNYSLPAGNFCDDFHRFSVVWDAKKIDWYMDDIKYFSFSITADYLSELRGEQFILLNLAVGGNWPGYPNATTVFPQTMQVDYVRVYKDTTGQQSINMIYPLNNSVINPGETITLKADVSPASYTKKVEFFQDEAKIGETRVAPYQMDWKNVQPGCYKVKAVVTNTLDNTFQSQTVSFKVGTDCIGASYLGYPQKVPGRIEAENFNLGGSSVGYYDVDAGNSGGAYRAGESVDIEACSDTGGGFDIGYIAAGEWLKYNINVGEAGLYNIDLRYASNNSAGGDLTIYLNGADVTGQMHAVSTGGWQTWALLSKKNIQLTSGLNEIKVLFNSSGINFNYIDITKAASPYYIKLLSPNGGESFRQGSVGEITWESSKVDLVQIGLSTNNGSSWSFVASDFPSSFGSCRFIVPNTVSDLCKIMVVDRKNPSVNSASASTFSIIPAAGVEEENYQPGTIALQQNFPNPFNPSTTLRFNIPDENSGRSIKLLMYNTNGQMIRTLAEGDYSAGVHEVCISGSGLASGIYQVILTAGTHSKSIKIALLK